MFEVESGLIIWEISVFALLIVVLSVYGWKPLVLGLKKRESMIRQTIENAEQGMWDAEKALKTAREALSLSGEEMEKVREKGRSCRRDPDRGVGGFSGAS